MTRSSPSHRLRGPIADGPGETATETRDVHNALRPYLPRLLRSWLATTPSDVHQRLEGSFVFVDVSGFTNLSERLARRGRVGAEELTEAIETCFSELLSVAYHHGGGLIKFGGDALLMFFADEDHAARACAAAVGMRSALREVGRMETPAGRVTLRMSVGVHSGRFDFFLVGDSHRELMVAGPAASEVVQMEGTAGAGEIVISPATAARLPARSVGPPRGEGFRLRSAPPLSDEGWAGSEPFDRDLEFVGCVPVAVREEVLAGIHAPEHRLVTVSFIHFDGTDRMIQEDGPEAVAPILDSLVSGVQRAADEHQVAFLATDVDHDGGKLILAAGAPRATGEDEERILLTLRAVLDRDHGIPLRIGVNRGPVFAGSLGPFYRRTYTVMGDAVNLAARLMAAAEHGRILAATDVLEHSRARFEALPVPPFHVKGKARPVQAFDVGPVVGGADAEDAGELPLIGRKIELEAVREAIEAARTRRGRVIELVGPPGIGKSRIVREALEEAGDLAVLAAASELYTASTPYAPFRRILRELLGIAEETPDIEAAQRLHDRVDINAPHLTPWLPLLGIPLDLEIADTPETGSLDDRFKRDRAHEILTEFLAWVLPTGTVLVFEDVHWMDEASREIVAALAAVAPSHPWAIVLTRREGTSVLGLPEDDHIRSIEVPPLEVSDTLELVQRATEDEPIPVHVIEGLAARSEGNPLFLRELLVASRGAGDVEALPDSVEALLMARIDRLAPEDRALLRHASVLGTSFPADLLPAILGEPVPEPEDPVWRRLGEFLGRADGRVRFRQTLVRDAAYGGLPYRQRLRLHARAGEEILRKAAFPQDECERLSLHFFHAARHGEAWGYSKIAGDRAAAKYANVEAASFYERAIQSARKLDDPDPRELASLNEALGDVRERAGLYREAGRAYDQARRYCPDDRVRRARLMLKQAKIEDTTGKSSLGLRWLSRAIRELGQLQTLEASAQRAQLLAWYGAIRFSQGRPREAVRWSEEAIRHAEVAGEKDALAHALYIIDWAHVEMGHPELATHMDDVLALYEELGDVWRQADAYNILGLFAYWDGRWTDAMGLYEKSRELQLQAGDVVSAAIATVNIAEILTEQGKLDMAEPLTREALRAFRGANYRLQLAFTLGHLGRIASMLGRHDEALRHMTEALELVRAGGDQLEEVSLLLRMAEDLLLQGDGPAALETVERALGRAEPLGGPGAQGPLLHRVRGEALILCGDHEGAAAALEESLVQARARGADYDLALTLQAAATLRRLRGLPPDEAGEAEATAILERLGVESVPPVPAAPTAALS